MEVNENSRFFRYVWRLNALVIAGAAILCLLIGGFVGAKIFWDQTGAAE